MVRHCEDEGATIDDATEYTRSSSTWGTLHSYGNINPSAPGIYLLQLDVRAITAVNYFRVKIGSYYAWGKRQQNNGYTTEETYLYLDSGSQAVIIENASIDGGPGYVQNFHLGPVTFSDTDGLTLGLYSGGIVNVNVAQRKLPVGTIKDVGVFVMVWAYTPSAVTYFESVGDNYTNGVRVYVEGSQKDWRIAFNDSNAKECAYGLCATKADVGQDISIQILKDNANTVVHINVIACPWILIDETDFEPIELTFPQGSTLYLMLEPLIADETKYIKIGTVRTVTFGDTTDYYSTATGTGILKHNVLFQEVKNGAVNLFMYGFRGCISSIGIDIR